MNFLEISFLKVTNPLFYFFRKKLKGKEKEVKFKSINNTNRFTGETSHLENMLVTKYNFHSFVNTIPFESYQMNLYILHLLDNLDIEFPETIRAIDVGSKNFEYAPSLFSFYKEKGVCEILSGIEIDAFRRYHDFTTRFDHANAYIKDLPHTNYLPIDFLHYNEKVNVITMFLPFVFKEPLLYWGLPLSTYHPEKIFRHAFSLLKDGGIWIITSQEEIEEEKCHEILEKLGISYIKVGRFDSPFYPYELKRYTTIVKK